jgi:hypothetical protein
MVLGGLLSGVLFGLVLRVHDVQLYPPRMLFVLIAGQDCEPSGTCNEAKTCEVLLVANGSRSVKPATTYRPAPS